MPLLNRHTGRPGMHMHVAMLHVEMVHEAHLWVDKKVPHILCFTIGLETLWSAWDIWVC